MKTAAILDREKTSEYHLTVLAVDDGGKGNSNSTSLKIFVSDVNDNAPVFSRFTYTAYLYENSLQFNLLGNGFYIDVIIYPFTALKLCD